MTNLTDFGTLYTVRVPTERDPCLPKIRRHVCVDLRKPQKLSPQQIVQTLRRGQDVIVLCACPAHTSSLGRKQRGACPGILLTHAVQEQLAADIFPHPPHCRYAARCPAQGRQ